MSILFLSRGPAEQISGGFLYNRYFMAYLQNAGYETRYHGEPSAIEEFDAADTVIVDSLVLEDAAAQLLTCRASLILLLHVVPRCKVNGANGGSFLEALYRRSRVVVTGEGALVALRDKTADVDVVKIEPGVPAHWAGKSAYADGARRLLCVANYVRGKGVDRVLDALSPLKDLPWTLAVFGNHAFDPSYFASVNRKAADHGLRERVELLGPIPHDAVNREMLRSDLLVHLSSRESYSMVTAEAIACGLPVLSYRTGNFASFARSGLVRYLRDDTPPSEALAALMEDGAQYAQLRRRGLVERRTWEDVGRDFVAWMNRTQ
jgi:glycosyltransferase involved in cell wall biosynthesis